MAKLKFVSGKGNEGTYLGIIRPDKSGILLSAGKVNGKIVPVRVLNGKPTEVPWTPVKKVLFRNAIRFFKEEFRQLIERAGNEDRGEFNLDDMRTMVIGPANEEGFKPFTTETFKEFFFTDSKHQVTVRIDNPDTGEDEYSLLTCRGSTDLQSLITNFKLGYQIKKFDWDLAA